MMAKLLSPSFVDLSADLAGAVSDCGDLKVDILYLHENVRDRDCKTRTPFAVERRRMKVSQYLLF